MSEGDSRDWFKVVAERGHFSNDPSDAALVKFFTAVSAVMSEAPSPVSPREGAKFAPDSFEAMGPLLYAFKDWSRGNFRVFRQAPRRFTSPPSPRLRSSGSR